MIDLKDVVKKERAKVQLKAPAAGEPGNGKTPAELENEILKNHKAMLESAAKNDLIEHETKPIKESELEIHTTKPISDLQEYTVEPVKNPNEECPFCGEEKTARGMSRHINSIHGVPGISLEDLEKIEKGEITPDALATEKGTTEIFGLSPEIAEKYFKDWNDIEEEAPEKEILEDEKNLDNPEPPGGSSCYDNPGNPDLKKNSKNEIEWTCPDAPFPFNLLRRKKAREE